MEDQDIAISLPVNLSYSTQIAVFGSVSIFSLLVPFSLGHPQWLVGTVVNACLFLGAFFLPKKYWPAIIVLPSLGVLARGIVFGPLTIFLVYFLPFIWLSNLILIWVFKHTGFAVAALAKFLILFLIANIYIKLNFAPAVFLQAMGLNQLATAFAGGLVAYLIFKMHGKLVPRS